MTCLRLVSERHIGKDVLARDDTFKFAITRVSYGQASEVHMAEHIKYLLQAICALRQEGRLNIVGTQINHLVKVVDADIFYLLVLSVV